MDTLLKGTRASQQVCLRFVIRDPLAFREYWVPQVSKLRYWGRYTFAVPIAALDDGDTLVRAGRAGGKSYAIIQPELVRHAMNHPGEETLLTSLRFLHIMDRMERVIDYFNLPFFKLFVKRIIRSPYSIELRTGHIIYGQSVGEDYDARMIQGKHASLLIVEEAQQYPERAWIKIQGAKDPRGSRTLMVGVPDGRLDTPFRKADSIIQSFADRRFEISRRHDPFFDQRTKRDLADNLDGEDSDMFIQEIDAKWGHPVWSAWDLDAIYKCRESALSPEFFVISGKLYKQAGLTPSGACGDLPPCPYDGRVRLAMDVGYSQPSEILAFVFWASRWQLFTRVRLINRMEHTDQADILHEIGRKYGADYIGIDTTEGEGRAIAQDMESKYGWGERIIRVAFTETLLSGWTAGSVDAEPEEVWEHAKSIGTRTLRTMFSKRNIAISHDESIPTEFNREREVRNQDGTTRVITPFDVHCVRPDQCVTTRRGHIPIANIVVGDEVLTHRGRWCRVRTVLSRPYEGEMIGLRAGCNNHAWVTPEHPVLVLRRKKDWWTSTKTCQRHYKINRKAKLGQPEWIVAGNVEAGDLIQMVADHTNYEDRVPILQILDELGKPYGRQCVSRREYRTNVTHVVPAKVEVDEDLAYVMGLYLAEGSVERQPNGNIRTFSFGFHQKEIAYIECVQRVMREKFGLPSSTRNAPGLGMQVDVHSAAVGEAFARAFGVLSANIGPPRWLLEAPRQIVAAWIRGLFQGDGSRCTRNKTPYWRLHTISHNMALLTVDALRSLGFRAMAGLYDNSVRGKFNRQDAWTLNVSTDVAPFDDFMRTGVLPLPWTWNEWTVVRQPIARQRYSGLVYNLEVEHDETFTVSGITVHNCTDAFRVFAVMEFLETPLIPPDATEGGVFVELEHGDRPSPWAPVTAYPF